MGNAGKRTEVDDADIQIGVAAAHGLSEVKIAKITGYHPNGVGKRKQTAPVRHVEALTRTILAQIEAQSMEALTTNAKKRIGDIFDGAVKISERLVRKYEALGENITLEEALEVHKSITAWAAKYVLPQVPTKLEVDETHKHLHAHVTLSFEDAKTIFETRRLMPGRPDAEETDVEDAEVVNG